MAILRQKRIRLYYIPFDLETYNPITVNDISKRATYRWLIDSTSKLASRLKVCFDSFEPGDFSGNFVRLRIDGILKLPIFVDREGGVLLGKKGEAKSLTRSAFTELKEIIADLECRLS